MPPAFRLRLRLAAERFERVDAQVGRDDVVGQGNPLRLVEPVERLGGPAGVEQTLGDVDGMRRLHVAGADGGDEGVRVSFEVGEQREAEGVMAAARFGGPVLRAVRQRRGL